MTPKPAVRRVTARVRERLNRLAEILYDFLPLDAASDNAVTYRSIFAESRVDDYLDVSGTKLQVLQHGLADLYRRHERLPFTIIRKVVPAAIEYRRHKRRPLTRNELDALSDCLESLDIDMVRELAEIELDESLPRITVPPADLQERLRNHDLDPAIASEPLQLFDNGHFNEAVRRAAERFEDRVRELSARDESGRALMAGAFSDDELLEIESYQPENRASFQDGYKFLAMGAMVAIRNVFSHGDEERRSPEECFEALMTLNWLFRALRQDDVGTN